MISSQVQNDCANFHAKLEMVFFSKDMNSCVEEIEHFKSCPDCHEKYARARDFFDWCQTQKETAKSRKASGFSRRLRFDLIDLLTKR